jgi:hypothetical protein
VIVAALAFAVLPADADPTMTPTAQSDAVAAEQVAFVAAPAITATQTPSLARDLHLETGPSPTPRTIRRPDLIPSPEPTATATPTPSGPPLTDVQMVANRGFESPGAWYLEQGATIATGDAHRGDGYLLLAATGGYADQRFTIEPGTTYRVAMYVRAGAGDATRARIGVRFEDGAYNAVGLLAPVVVESDTPGWRKVVFTFTPPQGATQALITFWNPFGASALAVDDISIRPFAKE